MRASRLTRLSAGMACAIGLGVLLAPIQPWSSSIPAPAAAGSGDFQRSAQAVQPAPQRAGADRGQFFTDGCFVDQSEMRWPTCVYGKRSSKRRVVLFGDSEAMQYFPALLRLARRHGWRLVGRMRAGCVPAAIKFSYRCDKWRKGALRRIERRDRPKLVVVSSGTAYRAIKNRRRLSLKGSQPLLRRGYARTLRRLRRAGARVAVIKDTPRSPRKVPSCVARSLHRLRRCAFSRRKHRRPNFDARAAKRVKGAKLINPTGLLCLPRICPAVTDDLLIYRDANHLTATFARTLAGWLDRRLPRPR